MSNDNPGSTWKVSLSSMHMAGAEERLGVRLKIVEAKSVEDMLREANYTVAGEDWSLKAKEKVYNRIVDHLAIEGYPEEDNHDFNVNDLVYATISPIIAEFIRKTGRSIQLLREKEIVSLDSETGGNVEFVVVDETLLAKDIFVLLIEPKGTSVGQAMKQIMLAMKDARDGNGDGVVYGFATTGQHWRMLRYNGTCFQETPLITAVFDEMDKQKELWMKDCSVVVDCLIAALRDGGGVKKDVVAGT
ncbi:hypothetical protein BDZ91DRAFT_851902 [Kalaharituber pfeilii]|nr:hypothetical protein BDZ91DRAFT_851902 [Kalaharituber pfeilii]